MKADNIIRIYGRETTELLRGCSDEAEMKEVLAQKGFTVSDDDVKAIHQLMKTMSGELRELSLDELNQITGGIIS
ncbi:MAG: hypothetical protein ACI3YT_06335 [Prevotella sp.]